MSCLSYLQFHWSCLSVLTGLVLTNLLLERRVFLATQPEICTCKVANGPQQNRFQLHVEEWSVAGGRFGVLLLSGELEHSPEIAFQGTMYSCKLQQVPSFLSNCSLITLNLVARLCFLWQGYIPLIAMPCHYVKLCGATPILD